MRIRVITRLDSTAIGSPRTMSSSGWMPNAAPATLFHAKLPAKIRDPWARARGARGARAGALALVCFAAEIPCARDGLHSAHGRTVSGVARRESGPVSAGSRDGRGASAPPPRRRRLLSLIVAAALVLVWEGSKALFAIPTYKLPHVHEILGEFARPGAGGAPWLLIMAENAAYTALEGLAGFA